MSIDGLVKKEKNFFLPHDRLNHLQPFLNPISATDDNLLQGMWWRKLGICKAHACTLVMHKYKKRNA